MEKLSKLKEMVSLLNSDLISKDEFSILKNELFSSESDFKKESLLSRELKKEKINRVRTSRRKYLIVKFDDDLIIENKKNSKDTYYKSILKMPNSLEDLLELDLKINHYPIVVDLNQRDKMPGYLRDSTPKITINDQEYGIQTFGSVEDFKSNLIKIKNQLELKNKLKHKFTIELNKK
jgi:hypothetical protein